MTGLWIYSVAMLHMPRKQWGYVVAGEDVRENNGSPP